jgi:hypothetical protein
LRCQNVVDRTEYACLCFCGKFDRLARRPGVGLVLSDFKTSSGIYADQKIQLAAYAVAIEFWMGLTVDAIEILRFGKDDGEFETELVTSKAAIHEFMQQAKRCRATYEFKKQWDRPKYKPKGKKVKKK